MCTAQLGATGAVEAAAVTVHADERVLVFDFALGLHRTGGRVVRDVLRADALLALAHFHIAAQARIAVAAELGAVTRDLDILFCALGARRDGCGERLHRRAAQLLFSMCAHRNAEEECEERYPGSATAVRLQGGQVLDFSEGCTLAHIIMAFKRASGALPLPIPGSNC